MCCAGSDWGPRCSDPFVFWCGGFLFSGFLRFLAGRLGESRTVFWLQGRVAGWCWWETAGFSCLSCLLPSLASRGVGEGGGGEACGGRCGSLSLPLSLSALVATLCSRMLVVALVVVICAACVCVCVCVFLCLFVSCRVLVFCGHLELLPVLVEESWSKRKNVRSTFAVTQTWW